MSLNKFTKPLSLEIHSSLQIGLIVLMPHVIISLIVITFSVFPWWFKLVLLLTVIISAIYYSRYHLLQKYRKSVLSIHQDTASNWLITSNASSLEGEKLRVELLPSSFVSQMLIILNFKSSIGEIYNVIITPDCFTDNEFRRLRVRLNYFNTKNI